MARPSIPSLHDVRQTRLSKEQVRTFSYVLTAIALGRLPGEGSLERRTVITRFLVALVMAAALWFYVTDQENPIVRSQPFTLQVVVQHLPRGLAIRSGSQSVTVTARGLQSDVNSGQLLTPFVDLSGISSYVREATVKIQLSGKKPNVQYTISPTTLSLRLETIVAKSVPVTFTPQSSPPTGIQLLNPQISPSVLTVSGPSSQVNQVDHAIVQVSLANISAPSASTTSFSQTFTELVPQLVDKNGHQLTTSGMQLSGTRVKVTLPFSVLFQISTLTVAPIVPADGLPFGYELDGIQPRPATVTVIGPPDEVSALRAVSTDPLPLAGVTSSTTITTHLDLGSLPPGVFLINPSKGGRVSGSTGDPAWHVYVSVSKAQGSDALPARVIVDHLAKGLQAQTSAHWATAYVTGPYLNIAKLGSIYAHVDATNLRPGTYILHPSVGLPASLANYSVVPETISVVITVKPHKAGLAPIHAQPTVAPLRYILPPRNSSIHTQRSNAPRS